MKNTINQIISGLVPVSIALGCIFYIHSSTKEELIKLKTPVVQDVMGDERPEKFYIIERTALYENADTLYQKIIDTAWVEIDGQKVTERQK